MKCLVAILAFVLSSCSPSNLSIRSKIVQLQSDVGFCTGEQVRAPSGKMYILTAAHCTGLGTRIMATTDNGKHHVVHFVCESKYADLALYSGVSELSSFVLSDTYPHDTVRSFSHGAEHMTYETAGEILESVNTDILIPGKTAEQCTDPKYKIYQTPIGELCGLHTRQLVSTVWAVPGSSGGAIVNARGELVGLISGTDGRFTFLVPPTVIRQFLKSF